MFPSHQLHKIIVSLSYTGTTARTLLVALLVLALDATAIFVSGTPLLALQHFVAAVGGFLVFDALYMTIVRLLPIARLADRVLVFTFEIGYIVFAVLPLFVVLDLRHVLVLCSPFFVLALRVLLGAGMLKKPVARKR